MLAYIAWNGNMVALILSTIDTDGEQQVALTASGQYIQSGNLVWSPDGDSLLLTMVHDPCGSDWRHSIVRIDSSDLTAETLIDQDERLFTIREWSEADTALLTDNAGDTWQLNILTGDITQTDI
jgi:Tol biopolymer transport system component